MAKKQKPADIDGYISQFPADVQAVLQEPSDALGPGRMVGIVKLNQMFRWLSGWRGLVNALHGRQ